MSSDCDGWSDESEVAPVDELRAIIRAYQAILDEHGAQMPTGVAVALWNLTHKLYSQVPEWEARTTTSPMPEDDSWLREEIERGYSFLHD